MHNFKKNTVYFLLVCYFLTIPMTAQAAETAGAIKNGLSYLKTMQNNDGGFTRERACLVVID